MADHDLPSEGENGAADLTEQEQREADFPRIFDRMIDREGNLGNVIATEKPLKGDSIDVLVAWDNGDETWHDADDIDFFIPEP